MHLNTCPCAPCRSARWIAAHYVKPRARLTMDELNWAWKQYSNAAQFCSLRQLSMALMIDTAQLHAMLRNHFGYEFAKMASRRGVGGDLFRRDRMLRGNRGKK